MSFQIRYSAICSTGSMRWNNQDNLLLDHFYLPEQNCAMEEAYSGVIDSSAGGMLAVFDGIGGEPHGETAAYIAARKLNQMTDGKKGLRNRDLFMRPVHRRKRQEAAMEKLLLRLNEEVVRESRRRKIKDCGTTVAGISVEKERAMVFNLGDSRVYLYEYGHLTLASRDHTIGRGILTQYIGMDDVLPKPLIETVKLRHGLQALICTDGLTACMSDQEIGGYLEKYQTDTGAGCKLVTDMLDMVHRHGAPDNTSIIWCRVE